MAKINFTKEHKAKMEALLLAMLMANRTISTKMGQPLDAGDLLHTTTINTLNDIRINLDSQIAKREKTDEWVETDYNQRVLEQLRADRELVNLVIGYKRKKQELADNKAKKEALTSQLAQLEESQKTPEDKIKELKAQLAEIDGDESF